MIPLFKKHLISAKMFNIHTIERLFKDASHIQEQIAKHGKLDLLKGKTIALLFCEPSTRTQNSFHVAATKLGADVIPIDINNSSMKKSETLQDTLRTLEQFADLIVLRHPEENVHEKMIPYLSKPIINAGDGSGEHPTQALLDAYTIWKNFQFLEGLNITLLGDLKHGRTVHSLIQILNNFENITINSVSPEGLEFPVKYFRKRQDYNFSHELTDKLLSKTDVLYVTRLQRERFSKPEDYHKIASGYNVTNEHVDKMKKTSIVMHPFPRVDELDYAIDQNPRARYFQQINNGVFMRAALLNNILNPIHH